ncbi:MAG: multidrug efflux system outer membrane protein [Verrucomicrobiales bacterium]|jgi:multidrug efflux system outer membrane protein
MNAFRISQLLLALSCLLSVVSCETTTLVDTWTPEGGEPDAPASYRRSSAAAGAKIDHGTWWKAFRDPVLDDLVGRVEKNNPEARAAFARVEQANATMGVTSSQRFPSVTGEGLAAQQQDSLNSLLFPIDEFRYDRYRVAVNASWEVDLWGKLKAAYRRDQFTAESAQADYEAALLSLQTAAARQYLALRFVEQEAAILADALKNREEQVRLQSSLAKRGAGTDADVARARTELESTRAEALGLERIAGKLEHAVAILAGEAPSALKPGRGPSVRLPSVPASLPSELLARRPDLRSADAKLRAAAQQVGVRKADFLPSVRLTGAAGLASLDTDDLFTSQNSFLYNLGPQIDIPIYRAGLRGSAVGKAKAAWREAVETYRAVFLRAIGEVENSLLDLDVLDRQIAAQHAAVTAAEETVATSQKQFDRGFASFFEVVDAQREFLRARRIENALKGERAAATVQLIQALGGKW